MGDGCLLGLGVYLGLRVYLGLGVLAQSPMRGVVRGGCQQHLGLVRLDKGWPGPSGGIPTAATPGRCRPSFSSHDPLPMTWLCYCHVPSARDLPGPSSGSLRRHLQSLGPWATKGT